MRPSGDHILRTFSMNIATRYVPTIQKDDDKTDMGLMVFVLGAVAEEFERGAHRRIEENRALRNLFLEALPVVTDADLARRMKDACEKPEDDFRISALDKLNCELQKVLIDLHAHVESMDGEHARNIEETIWRELETYTKRREFITWAMSTRMIAAMRVFDAREKMAAGVHS